MSVSNREIQLQKTCELYAYVLKCQGKDVTEDVQECADSYDYLIDCTKELAKEIENLDSQSFDAMINNSEAPEARNLANWWAMYQIYTPIPQ